MPPSTDQTKQKTAMRGGAWTTLSRIFVQLVQFSIFIVGAQVLSPAEFGVFALVAACIAILNQLATAGWPEYILQWNGDDYRLRQTLFVAIFSGLIIAFFGISFSFLFSKISDNQDALLVAQLLSLSIFLSSTGAAYAGVLNWQNKLTSAAVCVIIAETVNLLVAVWALWQGLGIVALAYGRLANVFVWCLSGPIVARILPTRHIELSLFKELLGFSKHIIATRILVNLRIYAATFIIAGFVGASAVGFYRAAQRIVAGFEEIVGEPTRILAWNLFRKARDDTNGTQGFDALSQSFFRIQIYLIVPLFLGVVVLANDLVEGLLGPEWAEAAPVLQLLAIASLIRVSGHASVPILLLAGEKALLPRITLLYSLISIACISLGAWFGIITTATAEVFAAFLVFVINAKVMHRYVNMHWDRILLRSWRVIPAILISLMCPLLLYTYGILDQWNPLIRFFIQSICIILIYLPTLLFLDKSLRRRVMSGMKL